jgi:hypothetical protein
VDELNGDWMNNEIVLRGNCMDEQKVLGRNARLLSFAAKPNKKRRH